MGTTMTLTEARANLPSLLDRVAAGEEITVTRHGQPVAVMVRPDRLRSRRADEVYAAAARIRELMDNARDKPRSAGRLAPGRAEELIAELRADRDRD
jgi:antitoxin (DNA-binding transcriptional repressor) of toxin-antitoxin stability system